MKIIVTGGYGFIGSNLIKKLLSKKNNKVLNLDAKKYSSMPESLNHYKLYSNYSFKKIDVSDYKQLNNIVKKYKPNIIFHLAAESHVDNSINNSFDFINTNIIGTYNLLKSIQFNIKYLKNFLFIHVSTDEVYGSLKNKKEKSFIESSKFYPNSPYSASKASSDLLVRAWNKTYNIPSIVTNCVNNYGPWQFPEKLIPVVVNSCIKFIPIPIYGNGKNIREWIHVEDHVDCLIELSKKGKIGETYNIGSGYELENLTLVKKICDYFDKFHPNKYSHNKLITFIKDRPGHDYRYAINNSKVKRIVKEISKKNFDNKLIHTLNWYINHNNWIDKKLKNILY